MEWWHTVILGLVEGITEYLPISSTGHLIIAGDLMGVGDERSDKAVKGLMVVIQGGAILAVVGLYWARFEQMLLGIFGMNPRGRKLLLNLLIAFLPAAVVGVVAKKYIDEYLFDARPVIGAFIVGGIYMIGFEQWHKRKALKRLAAMQKGAGAAPVMKAAPAATTPGTPDPYGEYASYSPTDGGIVASAAAPEAPPATIAQVGKDIDELTPLNALTIGCMQVLSMWPGTSRSMMTITGGMLSGLRPAAAAEFSFLLGMPTLLAATLYVLAKDLKPYFEHGKPTMFERLDALPVLLGILVAAVAAFVAIKWLVGFLNKHGLTIFGVYRIVIGVVLLGLVHFGYVTVGHETAPAAPAADLVPVLPEGK